jgi:hypothetical protein
MSTPNSTTDAVRMETDESTPAECSSETKSRSKRNSANEPDSTNKKSDSESLDARAHDEAADKDSSCETQKNSATKSTKADFDSPNGGDKHRSASVKTPDGADMSHVHERNTSDKSRAITESNMNGAAADAGPRSAAGDDHTRDVASMNGEPVSGSKNDENVGEGDKERGIGAMEVDCACDPGPTEHVVDDAQLEEELVIL